jgi:isopenicillin N synthase-like dioxygenase
LTAASGPIRNNLQQTFAAAETFFRQSEAEKLSNRMPHDSGYRPIRGEYSRTPEHPDEVESFTASYRIGIPTGVALSNNALRLHKRMLALFEVLEPVAEALTTALAERFGVEKLDHFRGALHLSSILQLNYSRPSEAVAEYINELHEDGCLLTITSVTGPGLELECRDGSFIPLAPSGEEILIMSGEILSLLSGGAIRPAFHRVRPTRSSAERMSLLFFADLHPKQCEPWVVNDTNAGIDIGERVLKNATRFGLSEWDQNQFS